jgi:hypothetical protein
MRWPHPPPVLLTSISRWSLNPKIQIGLSIAHSAQQWTILSITPVLCPSLYQRCLVGPYDPFDPLFFRKADDVKPYSTCLLQAGDPILNGARPPLSCSDRTFRFVYICIQTLRRHERNGSTVAIHWHETLFAGRAFIALEQWRHEPLQCTHWGMPVPHWSFSV